MEYEGVCNSPLPIPPIQSCPICSFKGKENALGALPPFPHQTKQTTKTTMAVEEKEK
jgi:hypothetical protein